jgi:hypothetical protein
MSKVDAYELEKLETKAKKYDELQNDDGTLALEILLEKLAEKLGTYEFPSNIYRAYALLDTTLTGSVYNEEDESLDW